MGIWSSLYGLGQTSPHELAFGVGLGPSVISLHLIKPTFSEYLHARVTDEMIGTPFASFKVSDLDCQVVT